ANVAQTSVLKAATTQLGIELATFGAGRSDKLGSALSRIAQAQTNALIVTDNPFFASERLRIVEFAAEQRLPAIYGLGEFVEAGVFLSYSSSLFEIGRRPPSYAPRILKGARPADLPVEQPTKFELAVNLRAAKALNLRLPESILIRADKVIE